MSSRTTGAVGAPVITAWSAVSPFGMGRSAFADGLHEGSETAVLIDRDQWHVPDERARLVPDFSPRAALGRKGTRSMDRVTGLAVSAVGALLADAERNREVATGERGAIVLGTTTGSVQSMMDFTRDSLTGEQPYFVDPAQMPNTVMNCAAGQCAIWHRIKGPNATIAGGRLAGLLALNYARRLLGAGRAKAVLCGSAEEYSDERAWLEWHARGAEEAPALLGEGAGMLLLEPADGVDAHHVLAEVLAVESGVFGEGGPATVLGSCLRRAMDRAGVDPSQVWAAAPCGAAGSLGEQERAVLTEMFGPSVLEEPRNTALFGDASAASASLQIASVLAVAERRPDVVGRVAVVTAVERDGGAGCALLRLR
ncbi:3-oxoacyl-ACP synthase [Streptomyces scopuliridis]|uniref:3-oxoacyl-ACP synthase n=1 Tax=Streptomyces scopuliridis TaxID=452529 RepID=A0ACD4ZCS1_9ACTN|nr:beta-ketoacyl synthase N-terminal-like domain-containing protein [Streptomyces scopuliridis]WSB31712.1 3-oxoacyl-ACP synthase [Streptomyces scopuliridis]WSB95959.1 3-oxoacyl-ACP synthase [Streptomyces scopuliridis]WSC10334.1 3-oxoacyl-ACP synthase [Streptomyces scopuliridis]